VCCREGEAVVEHRLTPAIHALSELPELDAVATRMGRPLSFHLKIDSGMGRL
jgi:alanine racemase